LITCVLPGVPEVLAASLDFRSALINDDFPTLDLPINATSGLSGGGHIFHSVLDLIKLYFIIEKSAKMLFVFRSIALVRNLFVVAKKSISLKPLLLH
jgi:hypothetical protein